MNLYLVKSDIVKARYFFTDENKAYALYNELLSQFEYDGVILKILKTSDEWEVQELVNHFAQTKESL